MNEFVELIISAYKWIRNLFLINTKVKLNFPGGAIEYSFPVNSVNRKIAYRIYVELITRKVSLDIDEENDVIVELYNSYYKMFEIIRNEIKQIEINFEMSSEFISISTDILNKGMRPHLTKYQAKFRRWYEEQQKSEINVSETPQDIQKKYPQYDELMEDLKSLNKVMKEYSIQLKTIYES